MATNKRTSTRKLQLVTKGPKLSAKGRKTAAWLHDVENGPVTLTRKQFADVYDILVEAALDRQKDIDSHIPSGDVDDLSDWEREVLAIAEFDFARLNRLLYQFERHFPADKRRERLNYQVPIREQFLAARRKVGGAA